MRPLEESSERNENGNESGSAPGDPGTLALAKAGHDEDCDSFKCETCGRESEWFQHYPEVKPTHPHVFVEKTCNCYISTLSDAVARGKKILEDLAELNRLRDALVLLAEKNL